MVALTHEMSFVKETRDATMSAMFALFHPMPDMAQRRGA
jgi:hypothetical protein